MQRKPTGQGEDALDWEGQCKDAGVLAEGSPDLQSCLEPSGLNISEIHSPFWPSPPQEYAHLCLAYTHVPCRTCWTGSRQPWQDQTGWMLITHTLNSVWQMVCMSSHLIYLMLADLTCQSAKVYTCLQATQICQMVCRLEAQPCVCLINNKF